MSDDNNESGTPEAPDTTNPTETIEQVAGQIGTGLDRAAGQIPEDETEIAEDATVAVIPLVLGS